MQGNCEQGRESNVCNVCNCNVYLIRLIKTYEKCQCYFEDVCVYEVRIQGQLGPDTVDR